MGLCEKCAEDINNRVYDSSYILPPYSPESDCEFWSHKLLIKLLKDQTKIVFEDEVEAAVEKRLEDARESGRDRD